MASFSRRWRRMTERLHVNGNIDLRHANSFRGISSFRKKPSAWGQQQAATAERAATRHRPRTSTSSFSSCDDDQSWRSAHIHSCKTRPAAMKQDQSITLKIADLSLTQYSDDCYCSKSTNTTLWKHSTTTKCPAFKTLVDLRRNPRGLHWISGC